MNLPVISSPVATASNQYRSVSDSEAASRLGNFGYQRKLKNFMKDLEEVPTNSFTNWWTNSDMNTDKTMDQATQESVPYHPGLGMKTPQQGTPPEFQGPSLHFASALRHIHSKSSKLAGGALMASKSRPE